MPDIDDDQPPFRRSSSSDNGRGGQSLYSRPHSQSSRIKTFFRQNRNNNPKLILTSLLYTLIASIYCYYLLFVDVGSGVDVRRRYYVDTTIIKEATAPIYYYQSSNSQQDPIKKLQPRSLADITIANVEVALKYHEKLVEMKRRQDEKKEEWKRKQMKLVEERDNETTTNTENHKAVIGGADAANSVVVTSENYATTSIDSSSSNTTTTIKDADLEYINKITSMHVQRTPPLGRNNRTKRKRTNTTSNDEGVGGFLPFLVMVWVCSICRLFVRFFIPSAFFSTSTGSAENNDNDDEEDDVADDPSLFFTMGGGRDAVRLRRRLRTAQANRRFQRFVDRLNAERVENGERQISAETLRHLVNTRDFNGNDYDQLHSFAEENGPALGSCFSQVGATDAEINRCPSRTLQRNDELLRPKTSESGHEESQTCSVCLDSYREGETVRTIPCFHTFHNKCIDPWLAEKAECPICKHSAIG
ncbi:hypothetical protein ACHAXM_000499 [Skeletonema potamos]